VSAISVLLCDDHTIVRQGLRALLETQRDLCVVGEAADGLAAVAAAAELRPDVVVMDLGMPGLGGLEALQRVKRDRPGTGVLVLSMHGGEEYVLPAVRAGADGYLLKGSDLGDLVAALRAVAGGQAYFSPEVAKVLAEGTRRSIDPAPADPAQRLSEREREVLRLVAQGHTSPQIAALLFLSVKTVEGHRSRIMSKVGIHDVPGLTRLALRLNLLDR
jgi:DNA-binding NarL/FixJ family response regulator